MTFGGLAVVLRRLPRQSPPKSVRRILIIRLATLGESLLTFPMARALKKAFPGAELTVMTAFRGIWETNADIDEIVDFSYGSLAKILYQRFHFFDVAIDTEPADMATAVMARILGKRAIGFDTAGRRGLYDDPVPFDDRKYEAETFLDLVRPLGVSPVFDGLVEPVVGSEVRSSRSWNTPLNDALRDDERIRIAINLGASHAVPERLWPLDYFVELMERLAAAYPCRFFFFGLHAERKLLDRIRPRIDKLEIMDLTNQLNISDLVTMVKNMHLMISADTGPMHLAAALRVPVFSLFGPNIPDRFAPRNTGSVFFYVPRECSPCINVHLGQLGIQCQWDGVCMKDITPDRVFRAIVNYIEKCSPVAFSPSSRNSTTRKPS